jgi:hypothetical protein
MGETLSHFIWRLRLEKAAVLLVNDSKKTVSEIALDCGFSSPSSFSRSFKKYFELTPLEWRKEKLAQSNLDQEEGNFDHTQSNERKASFPAPIYNRSVEIMMRRMNMEKMGKSVTSSSYRKLTWLMCVTSDLTRATRSSSKLFSTSFVPGQGQGDFSRDPMRST